MVNLDLSQLDTIEQGHLRVLQAIEQGMRNHQYVPIALIASISGLSSMHLYLGELHRLKLVACYNHENFTLTYLGADYLALTVLKKRGIFDIIGSRVGVGKEADVYVAMNSRTKERFALKFHKLGLTSFKTAKEKRNYLEHRKNASWQYLSRLAALREFAFLQLLHGQGFSCPRPVSLNRHCVVMQFAPGFKMANLRGLTQEMAQQLGWGLWHKQVSLLCKGVVHGDLNEYNALIEVKDAFLTSLSAEEQAPPKEEEDISDVNAEPLQEGQDQVEEAEEAEEEEPLQEGAIQCKGTLPRLDALPNPAAGESVFYKEIHVIDFPQMIPITDPEAEFQFDRDIESYESFLNRRFQAELHLPRFCQIAHLIQVDQSQKISTQEVDVRRVVDAVENGADGQPFQKCKGRNVKADATRETKKQDGKGKRLQQKGGVQRNKKTVKGGWE